MWRRRFQITSCLRQQLAGFQAFLGILHFPNRGLPFSSSTTEKTTGLKRLTRILNIILAKNGLWAPGPYHKKRQHTWKTNNAISNHSRSKGTPLFWKGCFHQHIPHSCQGDLFFISGAAETMCHLGFISVSFASSRRQRAPATGRLRCGESNPTFSRSAGCGYILACSPFGGQGLGFWGCTTENVPTESKLDVRCVSSHIIILWKHFGEKQENRCKNLICPVRLWSDIFKLET